jgi:hypothetical protein
MTNTNTPETNLQWAERNLALSSHSSTAEYWRAVRLYKAALALAGR